jgi:CubicO group peptidase (beta-lactamase class C family)
MWNLLLLAIAPSASQLPAELPLLYDQLAHRALREGGVPGLSLAIAAEGRIVLERAWGFADPVAGHLMQSETRLPLGSLERPLLASLVLAAQAEERLKLDDPLSTVLKDSPQAWKDLRLEQILAGTSGLTSTADLVRALAARGGDDPLDRAGFLQLAGGLPLAFTPGTRQVHDSIGWRLVPWILCDAFGEPMDKLILTQLCAVAELEHTGLCPDELRPIGHARDCRELDTALERQLFVAGEPRELRMGLCSTPGDVLRWWEALVDGRLPAERVRTSSRFLNGKPTGHGLGLSIESLGGEPRWLHDGGIGGFRASFGASTASGVSVCVLATCASAPTGQFEEELERFCAGLPPLTDLRLPVDAARAQDWVGDYQLGTTQVKLFLRDDALVYQSPSEELVLSWQGLGRFRAGELELQLQPAQGRAEGFAERRKGASSRARRQ